MHAVIASEVIEHVASLPAFCGALDGLTRPGGGVAISTLNRTPRSFALAVVAAEYVLRWVSGWAVGRGLAVEVVGQAHASEHACEVSSPRSAPLHSPPPPPRSPSPRCHLARTTGSGS